jgi:hypothetical protein
MQCQFAIKTRTIRCAVFLNTNRGEEILLTEAGRGSELLPRLTEFFVPRQYKRHLLSGISFGSRVCLKQANPQNADPFCPDPDGNISTT